MDIQKTIDRLEAECEKDKDNYTVRMIANHVIDKITAAGVDAAENKTIAGAVAAMRKEAEKRIKIKSGVQSVVLTDSEGLEVVDKYFGIDKAVIPAKPAPAKKKTVSLFDI